MEIGSYRAHTHIRYALWEPIGYIRNWIEWVFIIPFEKKESKPFQGIFDGKNHSIKNLTINKTISSDVSLTLYAGLFGYIGNSGEIKNTILENISITTLLQGSVADRSTYVGGIVGYSEGKISNCSVTGNIICKGDSWFKVTDNVGLIAGKTTNEILNCYAQGSVKASASGTDTTANAGGICGTSSSSIKDCIVEQVEITSSANTHNTGGVCGNTSSKDNNTNNYVVNTTTTDFKGDNGEQLTGAIIKGTVSELTGNQDYLLLNVNQKTLHTDFNGTLVTKDCNIDDLIVRQNIIQKGTLNVNILEIISGCFSQQGVFTSNTLYLHNNALIDSKNGINNIGNIVYTRTHKIWASTNKADGWHSICLPFDANLCVNGAPVRPVITGDKAGRYWLKSFTGVTNDNVAFSNAATTVDDNNYYIKANTPYIYALPGGSAWGSFDLKGLEITFEGNGAIQPFSEQTTYKEESGYTYYGVLSDSCNLSNLYILKEDDQENDGQFYETGAAVRPYRGYFTSSTPRAQLRIVNGTGGTTDLRDLTNLEKPSIWVEYGTLFIESSQPTTINIHDLRGHLIRRIQIESGTTQVDDLEKGVYIINGRKITL